MRIIDSVSDEQPTELGFDRLGAATDLGRIPHHPGGGSRQDFMHLSGPGTAQVGREGHPHMRIDAMKHGELLVELLGKQGGIFVADSGEHHAVSLPGFPASMQERIYWN